MTSGDRQCRICLETDLDDQDHDHDDGAVWLAPCQCKGSSRFVHRHCLDTWRRSSINPRSLTHCTTCGTVYKTRRVGVEVSLLLMTLMELGRYLLVSTVCVIMGGFLGRGSSTLVDWVNMSPAYPRWSHCQLGALVCLATVGACSVVLLFYHACAVRPADVPVRILLDCCLYRRAPGPSAVSKSSGEDCCRGLLLTLIAIGAVVTLFAAVYLLLAILDKRNRIIRSKYMDSYQVIDYDAE